MTIGERIKKVRQENGLSQKALGQMLGVSQQMIGQYEAPNANLKLGTLQKIADVLHVPINTFLELSENHTREEFMQLMDIYEQERKELNKDNKVRHHLLIHHYDEMGRIGRDSLIEILSSLKMPNDAGQKEASKRVNELTEISRYIQKEKNIPDK